MMAGLTDEAEGMRSTEEAADEMAAVAFGEDEPELVEVIWH